MTTRDKQLILVLIVISAVVVLGSVFWQYKQYDPAKSGLLVYTWQVGELPIGFTHFGYQGDSMIYLDTVQRIYKYGLVGFWLDPNISGSWEVLRYNLVVIVCRPLAHVGNLIVYGLWSDPSALLIIPILSGIMGPTIMYLILRELNLSRFRSAIGALLLLTNKYFLFEAGEALFDTPAMVIGMIALYIWLRAKRVNNNRWVGISQLAAMLYRQSNVMLFAACFAYDYLNKKDLKWATVPLAIGLLLSPLYLYHLIGGWTFFTPGLIDVEYHGSFLTKPIYFAKTFEIAFGWMAILAVISLVKYLLDNKLFAKIESIMPLYLISIWIFNFAWAINMGRFWMVASPPIIYLTLSLLPDWIGVFILFILISVYDSSYSIVANILPKVL